MKMKSVLLSLSLITLLSFTAFGQQSKPTISLPTLHQIQETTLSPSYSCRPAGSQKQGYEQSALFISDYSKNRNSPDLLFNGACGSEDYFRASTAGDDMSLIADLGENISIEEVTASKAFNYQRIASPENYSKFSDSINVKSNHTYAVLLNKSDIRGLFVFTVTKHVPNKEVSIRYAVKLYDIFTDGKRQRAEGFDWEKRSN